MLLIGALVVVESVFNIVNNHYLNHQTQIRAGMLEDECSLLVKNSFKLDVKITIEVSLAKQNFILEKFYKIKGIFTFFSEIKYTYK